MWVTFAILLNIRNIFLQTWDEMIVDDLNYFTRNHGVKDTMVYNCVKVRRTIRLQTQYNFGIDNYNFDIECKSKSNFK